MREKRNKLLADNGISTLRAMQIFILSLSAMNVNVVSAKVEKK
jgi:uncharacterized membrane protein